MIEVQNLVDIANRIAEAMEQHRHNDVLDLIEDMEEAIIDVGDICIEVLSS
jgi:hypothetical protein